MGVERVVMNFNLHDEGELKETPRWQLEEFERQYKRERFWKRLVCWLAVLVTPIWSGAATVNLAEFGMFIAFMTYWFFSYVIEE